MRAGARALGLLLLALGSCAGPALGSPRSYLVPFCIDDLRLIPPHAAKLPIPGGCHLIDCCPGCPGPGPLSWRVSIGGRALESVTIGFEGLSPTAPLELEGDAKATPKGVRVGRGGAVLHNVSGDAGRVPVATLALGLDPALLREPQALALAGGDAPADTIEIEIRQMLGRVLVNEFDLSYPLRPCRPKPAAECIDKVSQSNNRLADSSVVMLDGRRDGGCADDEQYRAVADADVGSVRAPGGCRSEVAVFSQGDAMQLHAPEPAWTDRCNDVAAAPLEPLLAAPVSVWLAWQGLQNAPSPAGPEAVKHFANANLIYDRNKTGIQFVAQPRDISTSMRAQLAVALGCVGAAQFPAEFYTKDRLNVYYSPLPFNGENCDQDRNMVFIGTTGNLATLAHEFGHALSLFGEKVTGGHTNDHVDFTDQNVMWGGGSETRDHFALGQAFRFNVDTRSFLNANAVRTGPTRVCPALVTSDACPRLGLDWTRP